MKKIFVLIPILLFSILYPLQASAASLSEVRSYVKNNYYGDINGDIYDATTINELMGMLDPYSVYFTKDEYSSFFQSIENETVGIGVVVSPHAKGVLVSQVIDGGPAAKAGLKAGDIITMANGVSLAGLSSDQAVNYIKGSEGTAVVLKVQHEDGSEDTYNLVRQTIQIPNVTSQLLYGNVGYIYMSSFSENGAKEVSNALKALKAKGAKQFIFDLRDNGGGYVTTAIEVISLFPKAKYAFYQHDANGVYLIEVADYLSYAASQYSKFSGNTSLLINGFSASASDMTAGAVKDQKLAKIYGSTSYGKGLMQTVDTFRDGSAIKLTIAEFRTPKGNIINKVGIKPDVETTTPLEAAHRDMITANLLGYKQMTSLTNVPTTKTFTVALSKNAATTVDANAIELVQLGGKNVAVTTKVNDSKISVTPVSKLEAGAQYMLIVHPKIKSPEGKLMKHGYYVDISVAK